MPARINPAVFFEPFWATSNSVACVPGPVRLGMGAEIAAALPREYGPAPLAGGPA
jgi:hypothetical protein